MTKALQELARIASVIVDGELANSIITDQACNHMANPDLEYIHLSADYYDVEFGAFVQMKKTLLRLQRLVDFPCCASLWVRVRGADNLITMAVQNGNLNRYWQHGEERRNPEGEMAECLASGRIIVAPPGHPTRTITVLTPVFDSLGDVVGIVELSSPEPI
ncbi:MAG: hypothetical protein A2350_01240 [Candidatus Raymondbacteria bacterium RifOxyB12_full_50_8]|nr:MAG: hypothetical protein A2350_01240 [Candidatus Raymondbacteria bacterium RifOxyB12_full_50_8]